jgi:phage gp16-like protein
MSGIPVLHIAKKEFGLDDDSFRDVLERVTGKRSLRAMSDAERTAVLEDFKAKGFEIKRGSSKGRKAGISTKKYVRMIFALWKSCAALGVIDDGSKAALRSFVANGTEAKGKRVDDPDFLTYDQAAPIIETLKSMERRGKKLGGR